MTSAAVDIGEYKLSTGSPDCRAILRRSSTACDPRMRPVESRTSRDLRGGYTLSGE